MALPVCLYGFETVSLIQCVKNKIKEKYRKFQTNFCGFAKRLKLNIATSAQKT
jgi:hypothetical protein